MRRLFTLLIVLTLAVDAWAWKPLFVGHRGCNIGVENTAEAYRNGVDIYGYDGLECDVRVTKDGFYVISHDETTNRVGGNLTVADATLAELQAEQYTQTRGGVTYTGHICTVAEYLAICVEKGVFPVIELKWTTGINNNDMSNFDGLAHLVIDQGLPHVDEEVAGIHCRTLSPIHPPVVVQRQLGRQRGVVSPIWSQSQHIHR